MSPTWSRRALMGPAPVRHDPGWCLVSLARRGLRGQQLLHDRGDDDGEDHHRHLAAGRVAEEQHDEHDPGHREADHGHAGGHPDGEPREEGEAGHQGGDEDAGRGAEADGGEHRAAAEGAEADGVGHALADDERDEGAGRPGLGVGGESDQGHLPRHRHVGGGVSGGQRVEAGADSGDQAGADGRPHGVGRRRAGPCRGPRRRVAQVPTAMTAASGTAHTTSPRVEPTGSRSGQGEGADLQAGPAAQTGEEEGADSRRHQDGEHDEQASAGGPGRAPPRRSRPPRAGCRRWRRWPRRSPRRRGWSSAVASPAARGPAHREQRQTTAERDQRRLGPDARRRPPGWRRPPAGRRAARPAAVAPAPSPRRARGRRDRAAA